MPGNIESSVMTKFLEIWYFNIVFIKYHYKWHQGVTRSISLWGTAGLQLIKGGGGILDIR